MVKIVADAPMTTLDMTSYIIHLPMDEDAREQVLHKLVYTLDALVQEGYPEDQILLGDAVTVTFRTSDIQERFTYLMDQDLEEGEESTD